MLYHLHVGVYFDADGLDLGIVGTEFERAIDEHVSVCEYASFEAHGYRGISDYVEDSDGCISLNATAENMGSYLATYVAILRNCWRNLSNTSRGALSTGRPLGVERPVHRF